jgi:tetratricopeptide (TPR) repeat protein
VLSAHVLSTYYRYAGRTKDADRELNKALNLARERDLDSRSVITSIRLGQLRLDAGDYEGARQVLEESRPNATVPNQIETKLALARTYVRLGDFMKADQLLSEAASVLTTITDPSLHLVLSVARGEPAFLTDPFPDADALRARAYMGLLEAQRGDLARGRTIVAESLDVAQRAGYFSIAARCSVLLAEIDLAHQRFAEAARNLDTVPDDDAVRALDPELRAQVYIWRGRARTGLGEGRRGSDDEAAGRKLLQDLAGRLGEAHRQMYLTRPTIAEIVS